jgi:hypothetical protein
MSNDSKQNANSNPSNETKNIRDEITKLVIWGSFVIIALISVVSISLNISNAREVLTMVFPVVTSWVGTVLAFYFGRENFESASKQLQQVVRQLTPEEKAQMLVDQVMMNYVDITSIKMTEDDYKNNSLKIDDLNDIFVPGDNTKSHEITRLPIVGPNRSPKYMIHLSNFLKYKLELRDLKDKKLSDFLDFFKGKQEFGVNKGFVVVASGTTLAHAKSSLEEKKGCADIFVTKNGNADEPFLGWISNTDLLKALK